MQNRSTEAVNRARVGAVRRPDVTFLTCRVFQIQVRQAFPAAADTDDFAIVFGAAKDYFLDDRVEAGNIAATGQNSQFACWTYSILSSARLATRDTIEKESQWEKRSPRRFWPRSPATPQSTPGKIVDAYPDLVMSHTATWRSASVLQHIGAFDTFLIPTASPSCWITFRQPRPKNTPRISKPPEISPENSVSRNSSIADSRHRAPGADGSRTRSARRPDRRHRFALHYLRKLGSCRDTTSTTPK